MSDVFVSYSRLDGDFGKQLHSALTQAERDVWMDWEDIPLTVDFWQEIKRGIEAANNFVLIMSPDSIGSPICQLEVDYAIQLNKRIIPLFHRDPDKDTAFDHAAKRAESDTYVQKLLENRDVREIANANWLELAGLNWIFFQAADDFDAKFSDLSSALDFDHLHVRLHTRLLLRALEWKQANKHQSRLLRGAEIDEAEQWQAAGQQKEPPPSTDHAEYILASRQYQRQQNQRLLIAAAVAVIISVSLAIFSGFQTIQANNNAATAEYNGQVAVDNEATAEYNEGLAIEAAAIAERQAEEANSVALISSAQLVLPENPPLALALAQEAISIDNPPILVQRGYADIAYHPNLAMQNTYALAGNVRAMHYTDDAQMLLALINFWDNSAGWTTEVLAWDADTLESISLTEAETATYQPLLEGQLFSDEDDQRYREIYQLVGGSLPFVAEAGLAVFSPDERYLAIGTFLDFVPDEEIAIVDTFWPDRPDVTQQIWPIGTSAIAFTSDSRRVAYGFFDGSIALFNTNTTKTLFSFRTGEARRLSEMVFHPDGRHLAVLFDTSTYGLVNDFNSTLEVWDLSDGGEVFRRESLVGSATIYLHPDNETAYVERASRDRTETANFDIVNLKTGELTPYLDEYGRFYWYTQRDENWDAVLEINGEVVELRDFTSDELIQSYKGHHSRIRFAYFSPDYQSIYSYGCGEQVDDRCQGEIIIWDTASGDIKHHFIEVPNFGSNSATTIFMMSPDNTTLVYNKLNENREISLVFMDIETGEIIQHLPVSGYAAYFVSDTELLISPPYDSTQDNSLWNIKTGELIRYFEGTIALVTPDGNIITANDKRVIVWQGEEQLRIITLLDPVRGLSLSNDGKYLVVNTSIGYSDAGGTFSDVYVYRLDSLDEIQTWVSENRLIHELTCDERIAYRVTPYCESD